MRKFLNLFFVFSTFICALTALALLWIILMHIFGEGGSYLSWDFINNFPSRFPQKAGIKSAFFGTLWVIGFTALFSIPLGIFCSLYLEEYASKKSRWLQLLNINIRNLAGMPSIVYGLLGLAVFVRFFALERSIVSGALTLTLLILPVIIISSQEAIRAVPIALREAAYALGARKWQVVFLQVLPAAIPGIMTGVILAISRAMGESAPLIMIGALSYVAYTPEGPMDTFTVLPVQIFNWASRPQAEFHNISAAAIIVLLIILFSLNLIASIIRQKYQKYRT